MFADMEQGLDKEGKEVLDELEKDGFEIAGREKPVVAEDPKKPEDPAKPADETVKPVDQKPAETTEQKPAADPAKPDQGKPADQKPVDRKPQYVPLPKYLDTEAALKIAQAKIEELTQAGAKPTAENVQQAGDAVKKLVEEFNYDEADAKKLVEVIKSITPGQSLPPEIVKALEKLPLLDQMTKELEEKKEVAAFETDFSASVLKDFPHLAKYKDQIKEKAYSDNYSKTPLRTVAIEFMHDEGISTNPQANIQTVDKSQGGSGQHVEEVDFANITDEQFAKLTPDQQDKFFAFQEQKEKRARGALN